MDGYTLRRAALAAVAVGAFVFGVAASSVVLQGETDPGVFADSSGSWIQSVAPRGYGWRQGLREAQVVVAIRASDDPGGWRIETVDGANRYVADASSAREAIRATWQLAAGAILLGGGAVLLLRARRNWVMPAAALALVLAGPPLVQSGNVGMSTLESTVATVVVLGWIVWRLPGGGPKNALLAVALLSFVAAWLVTWLQPLEIGGTLDLVRDNLVTAGAGMIVIDRLVAFRTGSAMPVTRPRPFDVAAVALIAGAALALVSIFAVPLFAVVLLAALAVVAIPTFRRQLRPLENVLLSDVREQAAVSAVEAERGRVARELHDVPLQELFGIIRRLEVKPGTEAESDDLRALASHLRNVAIDLRPPVLDDLGLAAALDYLAEGASTPELPVRAQVADGTGLARSQRPPEQVELAFYRIAGEAVTNALAHSRATEIRVVADVRPKRIELEVVDNGAGLDPAAAKAAARQKHMGLSSMRRRAEAIDADFSINATRQGTTVRAVWQA